MRNFKPLHTTSTVSLMLSLTACGPLKDMSEMHDATLKMSKTTEEMNGSTKQMLETTNQMLDRTGKMLEQVQKTNSNMDTMVEQVKTTNSTTTEMATTTKEMSARHIEMIKIMGNMDQKMASMDGKMAMMVEMNTTMKDMAGKMAVMTEMNTTMKDMAEKMAIMTEMNSTMKVMSDKMSIMSKMNETMENMSAKMSLMSDMNATMKEMATLMGTMNANMKQMNGKMSNMDANLIAMTSKMGTLTDYIKKMSVSLDLTYSNMRLVFTGEHRINSLRAMERSADQTAKLGYAAEYMVSQTYQAWDAKADKHQDRIDLMGLSSPDFLYKVTNYITDRNDFDPSHTDSKSQNLYALAAALDYVNSIELNGLKGSKEPVVHMLSMIKDGIRAKKLVTSGASKKKFKDLPVYQQEVINHEDDAIYVLRVRQNFLKGVVFTLATNHENGDHQSPFGAMIDWFKGLTFGSYGTRIAARNVGILETMATVLDQAADTMEFLIEQGINPKSNYNSVLPTASDMLRRMEIPSADQFKGEKAEYNHFVKAITKIKELEARENQMK